MCYNRVKQGLRPTQKGEVKMKTNIIYNEDCFKTIKRIYDDGVKCDIVLTSPPYNTGRQTTSERARNENECRYDVHIDNFSADGYCDWCVKIFNEIDGILKENGVILWNVSYGNDATLNKESIGLIWLSIADIIRKTNFTVADRIVWKKKSALPNNTSKNKLTRICEDVFVFCRKEEIKTFEANKKITSTNSRGQNYYENVFNFIEAKNNDGSCPYNKATYSSDFCEQLLSIYAKENYVVYDPFMGTGTTAVACKKMNMNYIGSEISENQCKWAEERLLKLEV
jgi:site-specific DNA-methyltransferase (adenine-specific)/modification methylase